MNPSLSTSPSAKQAPCAVPSCGFLGCVCLEGHDLCRGHFISSCYQRLEECSNQFSKNEHWKMVSGEPLIDSLAEIVDQAAELGLTAKDLERLEQAQLLDILFTAGQLMKDLRRSPRKSRSIPLTLRYEVAGHSWAEKVVTQELSRHGASIDCRIPIAKGELMTVERTGTNRRVQAKVRWHKRRLDGSQTIGIELLECADFWGFNQD
jgi:hypothetical protein